MREMPKNLIASFVRQQRKALKMTQQDLADRARVGIRFIRELEAGKPTLRLDKVNIVLDLFGHALAPATDKNETCRAKRSTFKVQRQKNYFPARFCF